VRLGERANFAYDGTTPIPTTQHRRERVISTGEEVLYLRAALPLLHDVPIVLFDTGMRPEECHSLRWDNINWDGGRNGTVLVAKGKTKAARRMLPMSPRVRGFLTPLASRSSSVSLA
jgi:integrase